jgi:hypothetical protein
VNIETRRAGLSAMLSVIAKQVYALHSFQVFYALSYESVLRVDIVVDIFGFLISGIMLSI